MGDKGDPEEEAEELRVKLKALNLSEDVHERIDKEISRYSRMPQLMPEATILRNYLDWVLALPWNELTEDRLDIKEAHDMLEADHYGLEKVKKRILEFLAVRKLTGKNSGSILCLVGPPGVGKTSLATSIAKSMNRKFIRASLGGVRDEAEIRGHRRTYIGALPGRMIQGLKNVGTKNPVFLLDEIDKLASDYKGDPSSALLEVFEPKYEALNEAVAAAHKKERNKDIELMRSNGQVNGAHMIEMMGYYSDIVSHIIERGPNSDVQWVKAQKDAANAIVPKFTSVEVQNRIEQAKNLDAAIDAFVAEQSAETHHEVISQYNELARTPMNFKLLDKVQDAYIPEGI